MAIVWAEPLERGDLRLAPGDIQEALTWFKDKTGQEPKLIILNRKNEHLAREAGDGINVDYLGGILSGEVWLSSSDTFIPHSSARTEATKSKSECPQEQPNKYHSEKEKTKMSTLNSPSLTVDNLGARSRPTTYKKRQLPDDKIKRLHKGGMGAKAIATRLKKEQGIDVSYKTIQRILSGERK